MILIAFIFFCFVRHVVALGGIYFMTLSDESLSNPACAPIIDECLLAGYNFVFDASGNIAFASLSTTVKCDTFAAWASGDERTGTISATSLSGVVHFEATYADMVMRIPLTSSNCSLAFDLGDYMPNPLIGSLAFESDNGDPTCRVTDCERAGYNYVTDAKGNVLFSNRGSADCPLAAGNVAAGNTFSVTQNINRLIFEGITTDVVGTFSANKIDVTIGGACTLTFSKTPSMDVAFMAQMDESPFMSAATAILRVALVSVVTLAYIVNFVF